MLEEILLHSIYCTNKQSEHLSFKFCRMKRIKAAPEQVLSITSLNLAFG